ncbi:MAG TPA: hypothetical protein VJP07_01430 [Dehalococcoidia bacterium]|nr:hypothetical protein [Dehalococcoidia bacterium]
MTARPIGRPNPTSQARLQLILILLAAWDLVAFLFELFNAGPVRVGAIEGVLGARAVGGATGVLALAYVYAARSPMRHRTILWLATIEQFVSIFAAGFHLARDDVSRGEALLPIIAAAAFLVALLTSLPRQPDVY